MKECGHKEERMPTGHEGSVKMVVGKVESCRMEQKTINSDIKKGSARGRALVKDQNTTMLVMVTGGLLTSKL